MSRYIDADALKKDIARLHVLNDEAEIRRTYEYNPHVTATDFEETLVSVFEAIDEAPSIDIVHCRECKYWQPHEQYGYDEDNDEYHDYCGLLVPEDDYYAFTRKADDFCSYGERNSSEKPNNSKERSSE